MKEAFFIFLVIGLLAALTAVKYRKQISGMIGVARMLRDARANITGAQTRVERSGVKSVPLVNCSKCGVWVPENRARKVGTVFECSNH